MKADILVFPLGFSIVGTLSAQFEDKAGKNVGNDKLAAIEIANIDACQPLFQL